MEAHPVVMDLQKPFKKHSQALDIDGEALSAVTHHNKAVVNLNVSVLPCCVDHFNQCCVRTPVEEREILLVIVLAQHTGAYINNRLCNLAL